MRAGGEGVLFRRASCALLLASRTDGGILLPLVGRGGELIIVYTSSFTYLYCNIVPI